MKIAPLFTKEHDIPSMSYENLIPYIYVNLTDMSDTFIHMPILFTLLAARFG